MATPKQRETRCMYCGENKDGLEIRDDYVLYTMRWVKRNITRNERGYRIVVCKEDYPKYAKARKRYEGRQKIYIALGLIFAVLVILAGRSALSVFYAIVVLVFVYLFSLLTYVPALSTAPEKGAGK
jgi:nitrogen fixation/metabolism regulation signal transduction histidine kinase